MSRQIVLDTETTGLSADNGDRIIEIGCVELVGRKLTGNNLHFYVNPERDSHEDALKVHGISNEFLRDKPRFAEVADEILRGVFDGDLGVALHRAGAFCRVVAAGRGAREEYGVDAASAPDAAAPDAAGPGVAGPGVAGPGVGAGLTSDPAAGPAGMGWSQELRRAAAMLTTAEDLEAGARRWRAGEFG